MRPRNAALSRLALLALVLMGLHGCASSSAEAWYNMGVSAHSLDSKIFRYTKAIELNPDYAFAYNNRGVVYNKKGLHDKAIADVTRAIALLKLKGDKHDLALAHNNRGNFYQGKGSYTLAIAGFTKAIELNPDYGLAYNHLAWVFATAPNAVLRNGKRAVELAERAVELDRDAHNLNTLSAAYAEVGRFDEAIRTQLQAIALLKKEDENRYMADFQRHLERYNAHKPWRMPAGP